MIYPKEYCKGFWFYDRLVKKGVKIEALNYDYWFELEKEEGFDNAEDKPALNSDGETFMIVWMDENFTNQTSFTYLGDISISDAKRKANEIANFEIIWI